MKIFVINVHFAKERRNFQEKQAVRLGLDVEFVDAVDAENLDDDYCQRAANRWTRSICKKDIACFQSHRLAWALAAQEAGPSLIVEDDVVMSPAMAEVLQLIDARNDPWAVIYDLEYAPGKHVLSKKAFWRQGSDGIVARYIYKNKIGLGAYVLSPRAAARLNEEEKLYAMADAFVWTRPWLKPYQIEPSPAVQMINIEELPDLQGGVPRNRDIRFDNASYLRRKLIRMQISLYEAMRFAGGLFDFDKRALSFDKSQFMPHTHEKTGQTGS